MARFTLSKATFTTWAPARGRNYPTATPIRSYDSVEICEDGSLQVSNYGASRIHRVTIERLPIADYHGGYNYATKTQTAGTQSFINIFLNVAQRMKNTLTFNDEEGAAHTTRFDSPPTVTNEDNRYVDVSFDLVEEGIG